MCFFSWTYYQDCHKKSFQDSQPVNKLSYLYLLLSSRDIDGYLLKMANNNLSATSTTSAPFFVPRIVMIATYDQCMQTRITQTINNYIQTDTSTLITSATQTRPFQSNETTQTYPQQNTQAIQTNLGLNGNLTPWL